MNKILAFFHLVRFGNLLIIAVTMCFIRWFVFIPLLRNTGFVPQIDNLNFLMLVAATVFLAAAGYVINDYFDRKADLINKPEKVVLGKVLSHRSGMIWHTVLSIVGVGLGAYVSYRVGLFRYSIMFFIISGLLWFYSTTYKRQVLLGNLVVAFLVACVPFILFFFELPLLARNYPLYLAAMPDDVDLLAVWVIGYSAFAFLLTFVRELVKDLEDFEGDYAFGRQTIPIAWGAKTARYMVISVSAITLVLLCIVSYKLSWNILSLVYALLLLISPMLVFLVLFIKTESKVNYGRTGNLLKLIMLAGLLYMPVAALWVF